MFQGCTRVPATLLRGAKEVTCLLVAQDRPLLSFYIGFSSATWLRLKVRGTITVQMEGQKSYSGGGVSGQESVIDRSFDVSLT